MVFYTSGTTADPKGVLHTRSTLGALVRAHQQLFSPAPADRGLLQFPLPHVGGILLFIASQIVTGSSVVFLDGFDPGLAMRAVDAHGVTGLGGPPAALRALLSVDGIPRRRVATLRTVGCGAADVSPELMREVERAWGVVAYRSYGMTECPMFSSGRPGDPVADRHDTDGRPLPGCTARIVDGDGRPLGPNREGEVELFGPQLCGGYLDPALNEAFTPDGFLRSGDLGILDDAGCLRITGRRKDVIIRKGETLSARDIEDVLAGHPAVADVAAIGLPDPERGERVCACLVLRSGHTMPSLDEVGVFMAGRGVMRQKIPEQIEWMAELPRNATGKVLKSELRARVTASR
jgi:cyclohexanecarboxylate-CoA ligase